MAKLVGARVYNDANISIPDSADTILTFNQERYDTDSIHSIIANTGRLTCVTAGKYVISGGVSIANNATGVRFLSIYHGAATVIAVISKEDLPNLQLYMGITTQYVLAVDEYVELRVYQSSGGALNVLTGANYTPEFSMHRIG